MKVEVRLEETDTIPFCAHGVGLPQDPNPLILDVPLSNVKVYPIPSVTKLVALVPGMWFVPNLVATPFLSAVMAFANARGS